MKLRADLFFILKNRFRQLLMGFICLKIVLKSCTFIVEGETPEYESEP